MGKTAQRKGGLFVQTFYKICLILMIVGGIVEDGVEPTK